LSHRFTLDYLLEAYRIADTGTGFFNAFFDKLAGSNQLRKAILDGASATEIRESWEEDLDNYRRIRANYLIYD
jgi:uncharacterized protein YbbC (DUF1343 family)